MRSGLAIALLIVSVVCVILVFVPDPFPIVDEIVFGLGSAGTMIGAIMMFLKKNNKDTDKPEE